jgi:hypothetical protein
MLRERRLPMANSSGQSASESRKQLNPRIDKMIAAYATAASAVGVALLATAPTAEAEIIYTKAHVTVGRGVTSHYHLDLNHDHIGDFSIGFCSCEPHGTALSISSMRGVGNMVIVAPGHPYSAAALKAGAPIGPKQSFQPLEIRMATTGSYFYGPYSGGPWAHVSDRYLGLKFVINGEFHYGWARMTVGKGFNPTLLTGYAYETIPNKPLKAGQTSETPDADETENPISWSLPAQGPSLGMVAHGAEALEVWRKKEQLA